MTVGTNFDIINYGRNQSANRRAALRRAKRPARPNIERRAGPNAIDGVSRSRAPTAALGAATVQSDPKLASSAVELPSVRFGRDDSTHNENKPIVR